METQILYGDINEYFLPLPDALIEQMGWKVDDDLTITADENGITLKKKEKTYTIVRQKVVFEHTYIIDTELCAAALKNVEAGEYSDSFQHVVLEEVTGMELFVNEKDVIKLLRDNLPAHTSSISSDRKLLDTYVLKEK